MDTHFFVFLDNKASTIQICALKNNNFTREGVAPLDRKFRNIS